MRRRLDRRGVAEQRTNRGRPAADRVVFGELTQARRQTGDRNECRGDERQREDDQEGDARDHVGRAGDDADERADPQHRHCKQREDREGCEGVRRAALDTPADDQAADDHHGDGEYRGSQLRC
jgi:hypothetical protein